VDEKRAYRLHVKAEDMNDDPAEHKPSVSMIQGDAE
jgi:hypothetical protein